MTAGRKPQGIEQVEHVCGSAAAKRRLEVLLANVSGQMSVAGACAALGLHESRFFELRKRWLEDAVGSLEPERPGRPARVATAEQQQIAQLHHDLATLRWQLRAAELREELALCGLARPKIGSQAPKKKGC
jgi:transposase